MVSIIIPVYNVEDYIVKCLESVAEQTYEGVMECLVIDDCGQDDSMALAEEFMKEYQGDIDFRIIHHKHNKGLSGARNTGIREARGEWLYFLDSDDWIIPECIELMMVQVEKHPDVEVVFAGAKASKGYEFMDYTKKDLPEYTDDRDWIQEGMLGRGKFSMTAWNRLVSSQFVRDNNLYFEEGFIHEDEIWNLVISQVIISAAFLRRNTYYYFVREKSIMTVVKGDDERCLWNRLRLWNKMVDVVNGYHTEKQISMILNLVEKEVEELQSYKQYLFWQWIVIKMLFVSSNSCGKEIRHSIFVKNVYAAKCFVYRKIHCE